MSGDGMGGLRMESISHWTSTTALTGGAYGLSRTIAIPMPPEMHRVARPSA
jgi:hypothetical protein